MGSEVVKLTGAESGRTAARGWGRGGEVKVKGCEGPAVRDERVLGSCRITLLASNAVSLCTSNLVRGSILRWVVLPHPE